MSMPINIVDGLLILKSTKIVNKATFFPQNISMLLITAVPLTFKAAASD